MNARINLGDLKSQIIKRVGPDRAQKYFVHLSRFLSQKLSKLEFNKLCILTLGRDNIPLHNQLIRGVNKNACQAKSPPPSKLSHSLPPILSNGDMLPPSPKKMRSGLRKIKDRPCPLGSNGKIEVANGSPSLAIYDELVVRENGDLSTCNMKRPAQSYVDGFIEQPSKKSRLVETVVDVDSTRLKSEAELPLQAPLGIPFCPSSIGGARKPLALSASVGLSNLSSNYDNGELCNSEDLRRRMERVATEQGLNGVTMDCANLLNNGLDAYLKRLIRSCTELAGSRSGTGQKQVSYRKPVNGVWQGHHAHSQSGFQPLNSIHLTSVQDLRVAMEINPQNLGENWPILLEKICLRSYEE